MDSCGHFHCSGNKGLEAEDVYKRQAYGPMRPVRAGVPEAIWRACRRSMKEI